MTPWWWGSWFPGYFRAKNRNVNIPSEGSDGRSKEERKGEGLIMIIVRISLLVRDGIIIRRNLRSQASEDDGINLPEIGQIGR